MTEHNLQPHYGPEELGLALTQPTQDELRLIEEGHTVMDTAPTNNTPRSVGFQSLRTPGDWGPAHHRDDFVTYSNPTMDSID